MEARRSDQRDPVIGLSLALLCPGLGHLYAGKPGSFAIFLALELWLFSMGKLWVVLPIHVFQAIAAGGAVRQWNAKRAGAGAGGAVADVPPPPAAGTGRRAAADSPPPVPPPPARPAPARPAPAAAPVRPAIVAPPPAAQTLDADAFFAELQTAWGEYRSSAITARQFADRKWRAIRAVRVDGRDEGEALVAAAQELSEAGVLTSEEVGQLAARVAP